MANNRLNCYKGLLKQVSNKLHDCWKPKQTYTYRGLNDSLPINMNAKRNIDNEFMSWWELELQNANPFLPIKLE